MFIMNSKKIIFIHIPKTGGDSVSRALQKEMSWKDLILGGSEFGEQFVQVWSQMWDVSKHGTALEARDLVGSKNWTSYYTFSFVRHPFDRIVSYYGWARKMAQEKKQQLGWRHYARHIPVIGNRWQPDMYSWNAVRAGMVTSSFSEFIRHPLIQDSIGFKPQYEFVYDSDNRLMVDFVGKLENFQEDLQAVAEKTGLSFSLPHKNKSKSREIQYDKEDREYIAEHFKKDYSLFDYD